jgi:hypothetical protein
MTMFLGVRSSEVCEWDTKPSATDPRVREQSASDRRCHRGVQAAEGASEASLQGLGRRLRPTGAGGSCGEDVAPQKASQPGRTGNRAPWPAKAESVPAFHFHPFVARTPRDSKFIEQVRESGRRAEDGGRRTGIWGCGRRHCAVPLMLTEKGTTSNVQNELRHRSTGATVRSFRGKSVVATRSSNPSTCKNYLTFALPESLEFDRK